MARPPDSILRPLAQVRDAYLKFMVSVASMLRADKHLPENHLLVQKDMAQVLKLETRIANVRPGPQVEGREEQTWPSHLPLVNAWPPLQATAPQEERHDVTALYHRMKVKELQNKFGLKVRWAGGRGAHVVPGGHRTPRSRPRPRPSLFPASLI